MYVVRVIEQYCFHRVPDPFNGQFHFKTTKKWLGIERIWNTGHLCSTVHCQHTQHLQMSCLSLRRMDGPGLTECAIIAIAGETRPNYGIEKTCQIWKTRLEYGLQQLEKRKQRTHFGLLLWQSGACNRPQEKVPRIWIQIPQRGLLNHIMPAARRIRAK